MQILILDVQLLDLFDDFQHILLALFVFYVLLLFLVGILDQFFKAQLVVAKLFPQLQDFFHADGRFQDGSNDPLFPGFDTLGDFHFAFAG